jgi:DNA invertase Pin-like site-specific DNA recombinase
VLPPLRPAAYVRVIGARSARDPHVRDQSRTVLEAARQQGWPRPTVYTEIGLPGWHRPRSALGRLAGHLTSGRHDAVIVADLSCIGRDPADVLAFIVHCTRCGVTVEAVREGLIDESRLSALYTRQPVVTT